MKKTVESMFKVLGIELRIANSFVSQQLVNGNLGATMENGLSHMKSLGVNPSTVVDLGAAEDLWSLHSMKYWPNAQYLLFEPLVERKPDLSRLQEVQKNIHVVYSAAGKEKGSVNFSVTDDLDGSGFYENHKSAVVRKIDVTTIDSEIARLDLKAPYFLKFDTHGFEVPILEGASETLKKTELVVMECYGFKISPNCLLLHEMISYMEKLGFRLADVVDVMRRPGDHLFWQCDVFFLRAENSFFKRTTYAE